MEQVNSYKFKVIKNKIIDCDWYDGYDNFTFDYLVNDTLYTINELDPDGISEYYINTMMKYKEIYDKYNYKIVVVLKCENKYSDVIKNMNKGNFYNNKFLEFIYPFLENNHIKFVNYSEMDKEMFI